MNRQPIDPDDPQLTAYAFGELPSHETAEFEQRLAESPLARKELAALQEMSSLLSEGLEKEWSAHVEQPELVAEVAEPTIVPFQTVKTSQNTAQWGLAIAAACALMLGVVALFSGSENKTDERWVTADVADVSNSVDRDISDVRVPALFLASEVSDWEEPVMAAGSVFDGKNFPVDASYLEAGQMIKASYNGQNDGVRPSRSNGLGIENPAMLQKQFERVDSYLPSVSDGSVTYDVKTGFHEGKATKTYLMADHRNHANGTSSVFIRGVVQLDGQVGGAETAELGNAVLASYSLDSTDSEVGSYELKADYREMQDAIAEVLAEVNRIEGAASASQVDRLRKQLMQISTSSSAIGNTLAQ